MPSTPSARSKARHYTTQALYQWQMTKAPVNTILQEFFADNDMACVDVPYFREALTQIPQHLATLELDFLPFLTDMTLEELDPITLAILRLSCYELRFRLDVPYRVVINEGVNLAKKFGATDSFKFVNGVLDKVAPRLRAIEVNAARS